MATKFFLCPTCGNVVIKFIDSSVEINCCGKPMQELVPSTTDFAKEKHLPVVECGKDGCVKVKVGSIPHPMTPDHHIEFIYLETEHGGQVKYLRPDQEPEAEFNCGSDKPIAVYEYCNIHGLWKTEISESKSCNKKFRCGALGLALASLLCFSSCTCRSNDIDNSTVQSLDLGRFLGPWYEIARFDHVFERGLTHAKAEYALKTDGTIKVTNTGVKKGKLSTSVGRAKLTDTVGLLRVSFFGPFFSDYRVMMLSDDYNYALIGSGNQKYLWILSRTPEVPDDVLDQILSVAEGRGYNTDNLIWIDQSLD